MSTTVTWNMNDDVKQVLVDLVQATEAAYGEEHPTLTSPNIEKAYKKLANIERKARINELKEQLEWIKDVSDDVAFNIEDRIKTLEKEK